MANKILRIARSLYQKVKRDDLTRISEMNQQMLFDVVMQRLLFPSGTSATLANNTTAYLPSDGKVSYSSGDRSTGAVMKISAGLGFKRNDSEADPEIPRAKPIHFATDTNLAALAPSNPTFTRIDRIFARPLTISENVISVDVISPVDESVSSVSAAQDVRYGFETVIAQGAIGVTPPLPELPSGWLDTDELARVTVRPGAGPVSDSDIDDRRLRLNLQPGLGAALLASAVAVASPLTDGNVQSALQRIDGKPNPAQHALTHFTSDPLAFLPRGIFSAFGPISLVTGDYLTQTVNCAGRGGNSRFLVFCYAQGQVQSGSAGTDFRIQASINGVLTGFEAEFRGNDADAGVLAMAYVENIPALPNQTVALRATFERVNPPVSADGWILVVDLGRV